MQHARIYSAPSLSEVLKYLLLYRLTGTLTLRPTIGSRQEVATCALEYGCPVRIVWGSYDGEVSQPLLRYLNSWGEIHFTFLQTVPPHLQLSSPRQEPLITRKLPAVTRPLPAMPSATAPLPAISPRIPMSQPTPPAEKARNTDPLEEKVTKSVHLETVIPLLTANAKGYLPENLPRYDRTIFLLINGRRKVSDLVQLTRRSLEEVYTSLYRLQEQHLILM